MVGITHLFVNKNQQIKKIVKIVAFQGILRENRGDGLLNSNHRGTGQGKTNGDLGERVPWVPCRIPKKGIQSLHKNDFGYNVGG